MHSSHTLGNDFVPDFFALEDAFDVFIEGFFVYLLEGAFGKVGFVHELVLFNVVEEGFVAELVFVELREGLEANAGVGEVVGRLEDSFEEFLVLFDG